VNFVNLVNFVRDLAREDVIILYLFCSLGKINKSKGVSLLGAVLGEQDQTLGKVHNVHKVHSRTWQRQTRGTHDGPALCRAPGGPHDLDRGRKRLQMRARTLQDLSRKFPGCFQVAGSIQKVSRKFPVSRARACVKSTKTR
jgi:hypothetical protein